MIFSERFDLEKKEVDTILKTKPKEDESAKQKEPQEKVKTTKEESK